MQEKGCEEILNRDIQDITINLEKKMVEFNQKKLRTEKYNKTKSNYGNQRNDDVGPTPLIFSDDIDKAIKSIKLDSSAGSEGILARNVKIIECKEVLTLLTNIILKFPYIPTQMFEEWTHEYSHDTDPKRWRFHGPKKLLVHHNFFNYIKNN